MTDLATKPITDSETDSETDAELGEWPGIDRGLLIEACRQTGLSSYAAINHALELLVDQARERRMRAYDEVQRMVAEGELDFRAIDEVDR